MMLDYTDLGEAQLVAVDRLYECDETLLVAAMGAGKTVIALTALEELLRDGVVSRVLVLAPLRVCLSVWATESALWRHLHEPVTVLAGCDPVERSRRLAGGGRIIVANFELLPWLKQAGALSSCDGLLVDELTMLKGGGTHFKALRGSLRSFVWRCGMTGTPVSESYEQMFYQVMVVDAGARYGNNRQKWLERYFYPLDYQGYKWDVRPDLEGALVAALGDLCHSVEDYRGSLPALVVDQVAVVLPAEGRAAYDSMRGSLAALGVTAGSAAVVTGKLAQISNGFVYADSEVVRVNGRAKTVRGEPIPIHRAKLDAVAELLAAGDGPCIIVYQYAHELAELSDFLGPLAKNLGTGEVAARTVDEWNRGEIPVLLLHPRSGSHGLNMAAGGCRMIWFAPCWSGDRWQQTIARIWRRGQRSPVSVAVLLGTDTVDHLIYARLANKAGFHARLLDHLQS